MVLQKGGKPVGWINFEIDEGSGKGKDILYVHSLFVTKSVRSAGISIKLLKALKAYSEKENVKYIQWVSTSPEMSSLTYTFGQSKIPIEHLDVNFIKQMMRPVEHNAHVGASADKNRHLPRADTI